MEHPERSCRPPCGFCLRGEVGRDGGDGEGALICPRSPALRGEAGVPLLPRLAPGFGCRMPLTERRSAPERAQGGKVASLSSWAQKSPGAAYWVGIPLRCAACEHGARVQPRCRQEIDAKAGPGGSRGGIPPRGGSA